MKKEINSAPLSGICKALVLLFLMLPLLAGSTEWKHPVKTRGDLLRTENWLVGQVAALHFDGSHEGGKDFAVPVLGVYPNTTIIAGKNTTVTPDAAPVGATQMAVAANTNFTGVLTANPATGVVTVTDAKQAGTYTVTVTAFDGGGSTTATFTLTVTDPSARCQPLFVGTTNVSVATQPFAMAIGDFNGDGKQDFAAANAGSNTVSIRLGDGLGGFSGSTNVAVGTTPRSVAVGDFNGDGKQDFAAANFTSNTVSIRLGDGAGGFSGTTNVAVSGNPYGVAIGDFNGDGKQDFAVGRNGSGAVSIYLGDGLGGFSSSATVATGTFANAVAIGDFNGDGKQDLAVSNSGAATVSILLGNGLGGFSSPTNVSVGTSPISVVIGDFNGDGKQDFAVANSGSNTVSIRLGDGLGGFSGSTNLAVASSPNSVAIGDFNGDGKQDLAVANFSATTVSIRLGDGLGGFSGSTTVPVGSGPRSVVVGDFNSDGIQDLAAANYTSGTVSIRPGANNEINVQGNGMDIADGYNSPSSADHTDFDGAYSRTFTIQNTDDALLTISGITSDNAKFVVSGAPATVAANSSATFMVTYNPTDGTVQTATITVNNDDCDEAVYDFSVTASCEPPVFSTCPAAPVTVSLDAGQCTAVVNYTVTATGSPAPTLTYTFTGATTGSGSDSGSGAAFNKGNTTVTITATNGCVSQATCVFTVTVTDNEMPVLTCPATLVHNNDAGQCTANVTVPVPDFTDNCATNQALFFDGVNDYVNMGDVTTYDGRTTLTMEAWVKLPAPQNMAILAKSFNAANSTRSFDFRVAGGNLQLYFSRDGGGNNDGSITTTGAAVTADTWHHVAAAFNLATEAFAFYVDGVLQAFTKVEDGAGIPNGAGIFNSSSPLGIGRFSLNGTYGYYKGAVDEIRVWNSVLSQATIQANMATELTGKESGLIAYYNFNQGAACGANGANTTLTDLSPSAKNGTLVNFNLSGTGPLACESNWTCGAPLPLVSLSNDFNNACNASGIYPVGNTVITWTGRDASGNTATCQHTVTVVDNDAPTLANPGNQNLNTAPGLCTANYTIADPVSDNCTTVTWGYTLSGATTATVTGIADGTGSGTLAFNKGETTVELSATDGTNSATTVSFTVTVTDNQMPTITCPAGSPFARNTDAGECDYTVSGTEFDPAAFSDNCPGATISNNFNNLASLDGAVLPKGPTTITWTVTDATTSNSTTCAITVTVTDNEAPQLTCAGPVTIDTDPGQCTGATSLAAPTLTDNCPLVGNGLHFDGINDRVNVAHHAALDAGTGSATWELWIKTSGGALTTIQSLMEKYGLPIGSTSQQVLEIEANTGTVRFGLRNTANVGVNIYSTTNVADDTWHHIAAVRDVANGRMIIYIDGNKEADVALTATGTIGANVPLGIGWSNDFGRYFRGTMDDCRIWNVARTQAEIQAYMNGALTGSESNLVAYYNFNQGIAGGNNAGVTTLTDLATSLGGSNNGTLTNFALSGTTSNWATGTILGLTNNTPGIFPEGATTVTWTGTDASGNTASCQQTVTVVDNQAPTLVSPGNQNLNTALGLCAADYTIADPVSDNCTGATWGYTLTGATAGSATGIADGTGSGTLAFNKGETTVELSATDGTNNATTVSFTVTVSDNELPTITCPPGSPFTRNTDLDECNYTVSGAEFDPTAFGDNCPGATISNDFNNVATLAGADLPKGPTTITWTVTDGMAMSSTTCAIVVTVVDNQAPTITCPVNIVANTGVNTTGCTSLINEPVDLLTLPGVVFPNGPVPSSGSSLLFPSSDPPNQIMIKIPVIPAGLFQTGDEITLSFNSSWTRNGLDNDVRWMFADGDQLHLNGIFLIDNGDGAVARSQAASSPGATIATFNLDNSISCGNCFPSVGGQYGANVTLNVNALGQVNISGTMFGGGSGNTAVFNYSYSATFDVAKGINFLFVNENTVGGASTQLDYLDYTCDLATPSPCGAIVSWNTPAGSDNCPVVVSRSDGPGNNANMTLNSGDEFPLGVTTICYEAEDGSGNSSECCFTVTVNDNSNPDINCPAAVVVNTGAGVCNATGVALGAPVASDNCGAPNTSNDAPSSFPVGVTTVIWTATDAAGNTASCQQSVTVLDNEPPILSNPGNQNLNTALGLCSANYTIADPVSDNCTSATWGYTLTGATTGSANGIADGTGSGALSFNKGETTVVLSATDGTNNATTVSFTVTVTDNELPTISCPAGSPFSRNTDLGECNYTVQGTEFDPTAFGDNCPGATISNDFNNAASLAGADLPKGATTINWTVTDATNNTATCQQTVTVVDNEAPTLSCPSNQNVPFGMTNPCSAVVNGIDAAYNDNCGAILAYAFSGATTGSGSGQASGQTFLQGATTVTYTVTDAANLSSGCSFIVTVADCVITFSGTILWEQDPGNGVQDATVHVSGSSLGSSLSNANGDFTVSAPYATGNFTVKPVKNINRLNGVSVADALAIQQHLTGIAPITNPFKMIAADVDRSNAISTFDATVLKQSILGNPAAYNIFSVFWRFLPQSWTPVLPPWGFPEQIELAAVSTNQNALDFYGIKIGDVIANFADPANFGGGSNGPGSLVLRAEDRLLEQGGPLVVTVTADAFDDLAAWQFGLQFDPQLLHFDSVEVIAGGVLPLAKGDFGLFGFAAGEIRAVWSKATGVSLPGGTEVFRLHFRALESGQLLSKVLQLDDQVLPRAVFNSALEQATLELNYSPFTATQNPDGLPYLLLQNQPNPFSAETSIGFVLPGACAAQLRVFDATGRLLWQHAGEYPAGYSVETLRLEGLTASGVLFYELTTPFGTLTKRMVRVG